MTDELLALASDADEGVSNAWEEHEWKTLAGVLRRSASQLNELEVLRERCNLYDALMSVTDRYNSLTVHTGHGPGPMLSLSRPDGITIRQLGMRIRTLRNLIVVNKVELDRVRSLSK